MISYKEENIPRQIPCSLKGIHFLPCWEVFKARFAILRFNRQPYHRSQLCSDPASCHSLLVPSSHFLSALTLFFPSSHFLCIPVLRHFCIPIPVLQLPGELKTNHVIPAQPATLPTASSSQQRFCFSFSPTDILGFPNTKPAANPMQGPQVCVSRWNRNSQRKLLSESRPQWSTPKHSAKA